MELAIERAVERAEKIAEKRGEKRGEKKGENKKTIAVVKKCLKKGMSIEDIADITDLSMEKIKIIIEKIKSEEQS